MQELRTLARFLVNLTKDDIPSVVEQAAIHCTLDTISVAIGAGNDEQILGIKHALLPLAGMGGRASIWGAADKCPLSTAVFLNGMLGHSLELDDVHSLSKTHIGTVVIPSAWGMAEQLGVSGEDYITAVVCGYEAMARVGAALGVVSHREKGWHVTGTAGTFGAAAACGKLLNLSEDEMVSALGLAGTQSSGLWAFLHDGANCKALHPARSASNGCEAALLAHAGMTGPESILTASDGGMLSAMSNDYNIGEISKDLGCHWAILLIDKKPYPCCRSTHCAIDAAFALTEKHQINTEKIRCITVETYDVGVKQCGVSKGSISPQTPQEAKFSTPYTVAAALYYGEIGFKQFLPEYILNHPVIELTQRVYTIPDEDFSAEYPVHWGCRMTIEFDSHETICEVIQDASGSIHNPLTESQQVQKARNLLNYGGYDNTEKMLENILRLMNLDAMPPI